VGLVVVGAIGDDVTLIIGTADGDAVGRAVEGLAVDGLLVVGVPVVGLLVEGLPVDGLLVVGFALVGRLPTGVDGGAPQSFEILEKG
jgi:hypothetical protein